MVADSSNLIGGPRDHQKAISICTLVGLKMNVWSVCQDTQVGEVNSTR